MTSFKIFSEVKSLMKHITASFYFIYFHSVGRSCFVLNLHEVYEVYLTVPIKLLCSLKYYSYIYEKIKSTCVRMDANAIYLNHLYEVGIDQYLMLLCKVLPTTSKSRSVPLS